MFVLPHWNQLYLKIENSTSSTQLSSKSLTPVFPTNSNSTHRHQQKRISPLDIPEILQQIFYFIDDNYTLSRTVLLVCKDWFMMNQHRVIREWVWDSDRKDLIKIDKQLSRLIGAGRVRLHYGWESREDHREAIRRALEECQVGFEKRQQKRDRAASGSQHDRDRWRSLFYCRSRRRKSIMNRRYILDRPLLQLELRGAECYQVLPELLPHLRHLTSFHLGTTYGYYLELDIVLEACPHLENLYVGSPSDLALIGSLVAREQIEKANLRLKSFTLENIWISQAMIEDLVSAAPLLNNLRLIGLHRGTITSREYIQYDRTRLMSHILKTLQRPLNSFHFSVYDEETLTEKEIQEVISRICPKSEELTLWSPNLTPAMSKYLMHLPNVVTSLELNYISRSYNGVDCALHRYLCVSPSLLHLKVPKSTYLFDHLDLHHRLQYIHSGPSVRDIQARPCTRKTSRSEIWACRKLQTLWMAFHNQGVSLLVTPTHSRILFGYLSRVCPQLVDVRLFAPEIHISERQKIYPSFELRLHGGMCLLARLKNLENLQLFSYDRTTTHERQDLSWMIPNSKWTIADKNARKKKMTEWISWLEMEKTQEKWQQSSHIAKVDWGDTPPELVWDLRYLGMLKDVDLMLQELENKEFKLWPRSPRISVGPRQGFGYQPETFINSFTWD